MITDPNKLVPFIPLSKDSDGGFNALFYCSNKKEGDIVIVLILKILLNKLKLKIQRKNKKTKI